MIAHLLRRETADRGWRWLGRVDGLYVRAWVQPWPRASGETGYGYEFRINNVGGSGWRSDLGGFDTIEDAERAMLDTIARAVEKWWRSIADAPQAELELGARLAAGAGLRTEGQRP